MLPNFLLRLHKILIALMKAVYKLPKHCFMGGSTCVSWSLDGEENWKVGLCKESILSSRTSVIDRKFSLDTINQSPSSEMWHEFWIEFFLQKAEVVKWILIYRENHTF